MKTLILLVRRKDLQEVYYFSLVYYVSFYSFAYVVCSDMKLHFCGERPQLFGAYSRIAPLFQNQCETFHGIVSNVGNLRNDLAKVVAPQGPILFLVELKSLDELQNGHGVGIVGVPEFQDDCLLRDETESIFVDLCTAEAQ